VPCVRVLIYIASTNVYVLWKFMATCGRQWNDSVPRVKN